MNAENISILPHLHRVAEQRAAGLAWPAIAEKLKIDENSIRLWVVRQPIWERLLSDARREFAAEMATKAMIALGNELQSPDAKIRMNAAIPLLRLHQTNLRHASKANKDEFPSADEFAMQTISENTEEKYPDREDVSPISKNVIEEPLGNDDPPRVEGKFEIASPSRLVSKHFSGRSSLPPLPSRLPGGKIDLRRNMLLAPLLTPKKTDRPPDGKPR